MKYVMLDTNIVIDMVVDRRHQMSDKLLSTFIKLLEYNEIRLVIPSIVKYETFRNLEEEIEKVGKNIEAAMDGIKELYGISAYKVGGLDIEEYKKKSREQLNQAQEMFQQGKEEYKKNLFNTIDLVFNHKNCITIDDDSYLDILVMKRRIYKRAPFHKEKKESYADGLIAETLINVSKYIEVKEEDIIYFVTGNYKDFCDTEHNKNNLHPHILADLKSHNIDCKVVYVKTFGQLIKKELKENVENAKLSEEFEEELRREEEEERAMYELDYEDMLRESAGLTSLSDFESKLEDNLIDSDFLEKVVSVFERINSCYDKIEEYFMFYDDDLSCFVNGCDIVELKKVFEDFRDFFEKKDIHVIQGESIEDFHAIVNWIEEQKDSLREIPFEDKLPDSIEFGCNILIYDYKHNKFYFQLDEMFLTPENGSSDTIDFNLKDNVGKICASGRIDITYGFIEFDDAGGAADGCEEDIEYFYENMLAYLERIAEEWENFVAEQEEFCTCLQKQFKL